MTTSRQRADRRQARSEQAAYEARRHAAHQRLAADLRSGAASEALDQAHQAVALWASRQTCSPFYIEAWGRLLDGTPSEVGARLAELRLPQDAALLQNTPFGAALGAYRPQP